MSNVVNLNKFRKAKTKAEKRRTADENRVRFGQTKAEKKRRLKEAALDASRLDGARITPDGRDGDDR